MTLAGERTRLAATLALAAAVAAGARAAPAAEPGVDLRWWDRFMAGAQSPPSVAVAAVAKPVARVFVAAGARDAAGGVTFEARAHAAATGDLLWRQTWTGSAPFDRPYALLAAKRRGLFLVLNDGATFTLRALDPATGATLWSSTPPAGAAGQARALVVRGRNVVLAGTTGSDLGVWSFARDDGALLWSQSFDWLGRLERANAVTVRDGRVVVAGVAQDAFANDHLVARAYDAASGTPLWGQVVGVSDAFADETTGNAVAVTDRAQVVAGGSWRVGGKRGSVALWWTQIYDAASGAPLGGDDLERGGDPDGVLAIAAAQRAVYLAGSAGAAGGGAFADLEWLVRAYDASTWQLLWQDELARGPEVAALDVKAHAGQVIAVGRADPRRRVSPEDTDMLVRGYDAASGELLWQEEHDESRGLDELTEVAAAGARAFAAGTAQDVDGTFFAVVRAYALHASERVRAAR
jgi:hypothetical protein